MADIEVELPDGTIISGPTREAALAGAKNYLARKGTNEGVVSDLPGGGWHNPGGPQSKAGQEAEAMRQMGANVPPDEIATGAGVAGTAMVAPAIGVSGAAALARQAALGAGGAYVGGHVGKYLGGDTGEKIGKIGGSLAGLSGALPKALLVKGSPMGLQIIRALLGGEAKAAAGAEVGAIPSARVLAEAERGAARVTAQMATKKAAAEAAAQQAKTAAAEAASGRLVSQTEKIGAEEAAKMGEAQAIRRTAEAARSATTKAMEGKASEEALKMSLRAQNAQAVARAAAKEGAGAATIAIAAPAAAEALPAARATAQTAQLARGTLGKFGQKVWMLVKDGKPVKVLTEAEAHALRGAPETLGPGEGITWIKNVLGD